MSETVSKHVEPTITIYWDSDFSNSYGLLEVKNFLEDHSRADTDTEICPSLFQCPVCDFKLDQIQSMPVSGKDQASSDPKCHKPIHCWWMAAVIRELCCLSWKTVHKVKCSNDIANMRVKIRWGFVCLSSNICWMKAWNNLRLPKMMLQWWNSKYGKIIVFSHCGIIFWTFFDGEPVGVVNVVFCRAPAAQGSFHEHTT